MAKYQEVRWYALAGLLSEWRVANPEPTHGDALLMASVERDLELAFRILFRGWTSEASPFLFMANWGLCKLYRITHYFT